VRIVQNGETLGISGIRQLCAADAALFQSTLRGALRSRPDRVEIDLSETGFVDCTGVGALVAVCNCARRRNANATIRLLHPGQPARQLLRMTGMDQYFGIE
jgi:anti-anti-sigma factor